MIDTGVNDNVFCCRDALKPSKPEQTWAVGRLLHFASFIFHAIIHVARSRLGCVCELRPQKEHICEYVNISQVGIVIEKGNALLSAPGVTRRFSP